MEETTRRTRNDTFSGGRDQVDGMILIVGAGTMLGAELAVFLESTDVSFVADIPLRRVLEASAESKLAVRFPPLSWIVYCDAIHDPDEALAAPDSPARSPAPGYSATTLPRPIHPPRTPPRSGLPDRPTRQVEMLCGSGTGAVSLRVPGDRRSATGHPRRQGRAR